MNKVYYDSVESYYKSEFRGESSMIQETKRNRRKFLDTWSILAQVKIR